jgi:hypothetical protein
MKPYREVDPFDEDFFRILPKVSFGNSVGRSVKVLRMVELVACQPASYFFSLLLTASF